MAKKWALKKKRGMRRRRVWRRKPRTVNVNRALAPVAQRYITKMKYSDVFTLSSTNGWSQYMNLNSIYDPNRTGVGHQPFGYDQLSTLYNRYRVIATSYHLTAYSGGSVIRFAALPLNETISFTSMSYICENPRAKWTLQIPNGDLKKVSGKCYIPSLVGRSKSQYMADDRYQATINADPGELALLGIFGSANDDMTTTITCQITMEYTVEFFDIKTPQQS